MTIFIIHATFNTVDSNGNSKGHNVTLRFWGNAILTSCYQINCTTFVVLQNRVPHSILFPKQAFFSVQLQFVVVMFCHDLTLGKDKFAAKYLKCLFLDILGGREVTIAIFLNTYIF